MKLIIECTEQTYSECKKINGLSVTASVIANGTPYNPSGDCISRSVVKRMISDKSIPIKFEEEKRGNWQRSSGVLLNDVCRVIDNVPPVEPERPKGRWQRITSQFYKCSVCGRNIHAHDVDLGYYPFCHCGADMRTEDK